MSERDDRTPYLSGRLPKKRPARFHAKAERGLPWLHWRLSPHDMNGEDAALVTRPPSLGYGAAGQQAQMRSQSSSHNMNCQNPSLMTGQQIIDEIANDGVGLVA